MHTFCITSGPNLLKLLQQVSIIPSSGQNFESISISQSKKIGANLGKEGKFGWSVKYTPQCAQNMKNWKKPRISGTLVAMT